jgi:rhodanese-related sulfurtransferase
MLTKILATAAFAAAMTSFANAQDVRIAPDMPNASFEINGQSFLIERNQDQSAKLEGDFTKTSRACPPFCIHPMSAEDGVETIGEIELIGFMKEYVSQGRGLLVDSRIPAWFEKGTIPGAINIPFSTLEPTNAYRDQILQALGATKEGEVWDFSNAIELALFCNGPWCDQSPRAIQNLVAVGYPSEKIRYYRGGMQLWLMLGLSTASAQNS